ncbi:DUF4158 domain-containing protein [Streptosporangium minutum]|uniref:DUF4158 domain-containing protein n=1 Tax=Streptosporangium minutum TaxID=569862 RepID=A0A243RCM5_9ACTN|nr:hypothetical protein CA984_30100 [Streptosporangium minutum]
MGRYTASDTGRWRSRGGDDPSQVKRYVERPKTAYEHAWMIRDAYGYHDFDDRESRLSLVTLSRRTSTSSGVGGYLTHSIWGSVRHVGQVRCGRAALPG